jgi:hypothetical protein
MFVGFVKVLLGVWGVLLVGRGVGLAMRASGEDVGRRFELISESR